MLNEEFLIPSKMTQRALAEKMGYEVKAINRLIHEHTKVTPEMARALSKALGTSAEFWLGLQNGVVKHPKVGPVEMLVVMLEPSSSVLLLECKGVGCVELKGSMGS